MSLLMDALRKAEEAKKKAELEGKSGPAADKPADADDDSTNIQLEFEAPEPAPEAAAPPPPPADDPKPDASAPATTSTVPEREDMDELAAQEEEADAIAASAELEEEPGDTEAESLSTQDAAGEYGIEFDVDDAASLAEAALASAAEAPVPDYAQKPTKSITQPATTGFDDYSIDFQPSKPADVTPRQDTSPGKPAQARESGQTSERVVKKPPVTPRAEQPAARSAAPQMEVDTELEEQDRRSARNVFAAKKVSSPLRKNLQLTALSVAALLVMGFGLYFYISLRSPGGIAIPVAGVDYQQQPGFTDEVDTDQADTLVDTADATDIAASAPSPAVVAPGISTVVTTPEISVSFADTPIPTAGNIDTVQPVVEPATAPSVAVTTAPAPAPTVPTAPVTTPATTLTTPITMPTPPPVRVPDIAQTTDTAATSAQSTAARVPATPAQTATVSDTATRAVTEPVAAASAAALQPELIEPVAPQVSFTRRASATSANPLVVNAYAAYQRGDLAEAERLYREALAAAPLNRSALLGLAAIVAGRSDTVAALELYSRLLARDPSDPVAQAGLLEIMPRGDLQQQETALKRLRSQHPDVAPLAYAVGNFMASQQRWSEAQQAYFAALQLAKNDALGAVVNPDYAFNLAVSLEHLGQPRSASNYYREALTLAAAHPAGFDQAVARARLSSMESSTNE